MNGLTRDCTTEPVSRDHILRRERGRGGKKNIFPVQLTTSRIDNLTRFNRTLCYGVCDGQSIPLVYLFRLVTIL